MRLALLSDLLRGLGRMELLCAAEGGTDVDGVVGDLHGERTGFTTVCARLGGC